MSTEIENKINDFCIQKEAEKQLKKELTEKSNSIKAYMAEHKDEDISTDNFTVHISVRKEEVIDEAKMLEILKRNWTEHNGSMQCPYIRTREYIDFDMLEPVIYNGELPDEVLLELDKCRSEKVTRALTYKKVKKEEE